MFFVYIIYSESFDKYYVGQTNAIEQRLLRHNAGRVRSTAPYLPWKLICLIRKTSRSHAVLLERKLKNLGKVRLQKFADKYGAAGTDDQL